MFYKSLPLVSLQTLYTTYKPDKPLHVLDTIYDLTKEGRHNISNSEITKYSKIKNFQGEELFDIQGKELYNILKVLLDKGFISEIFSIKGLIGMSGYTAVSITNTGLIHVENSRMKDDFDDLVDNL